jgi:hypothetical protein
MSGIKVPEVDQRSPLIRDGKLASDTWALVLRRISGLIQRTGGIDGQALGPLPSYTVATLPSASTNVRGLIYVDDETGGAVVAFSDGTNWRRVTDRAVVS